jgi:hypothetical protein
MATSVKDLKSRLGKFLSDPRGDKDFQAWFAMLLMDVNRMNDPALSDLAYAVRRAFSDAADGVYTPQELRDLLTDYADQTEVSLVSGFSSVVDENAKNFWVLAAGQTVSCGESSPASQVSYFSASGSFVPSFFSNPMPVSVRDKESNFWGSAVPVRDRSAA